MRTESYKRLGMALVGLALPLTLVTPVAAAPRPDEVAAVSTTCILDLGVDISTCAGAVGEGVEETVETDVNKSLSDEGIVYSVDIGINDNIEPGNFPADINNIAINPLPPLPPAPLAPAAPYVPYQ
jgi:hypothetical protein